MGGRERNSRGEIWSLSEEPCAQRGGKRELVVEQTVLQTPSISSNSRCRLHSHTSSTAPAAVAPAAAPAARGSDGTSSSRRAADPSGRTARGWSCDCTPSCRPSWTSRRQRGRVPGQSSPAACSPCCIPSASLDLGKRLTERSSKGWASRLHLQASLSLTVRARGCGSCSCTRGCGRRASDSAASCQTRPCSGRPS